MTLGVARLLGIALHFAPLHEVGMQRLNVDSRSWCWLFCLPLPQALRRGRPAQRSHLARLQQQYDGELTLVRAKLTKADLRVRGLEGQVEQKQKENDELVAICDDLIRKMEKGGSVGGGDKK